MERRSPTAQRRHPRETFTGNGWDNDRILNAVENAEDFYLDARSLPEDIRPEH